MFKVKISNQDGDVTATIDSDRGNTFNTIEFENINSMSLLALLWLKFDDEPYGAFGHRFNRDHACPVDLHSWLVSNPQFKFEILEGEDLVSDYNVDIPVNAIT